MAGRVVRDINRISDVLSVVDDLKRTKLQVGIFAPEGSEEYMIAMVNEFGCEIKVTPKMRAYLHHAGLHLKATTTVIKIPERSFIRAGYEHNRDELEQLVERGLPAVLNLQMPVEQFYGIIGEFIVGKLHEYVQSVTAPPNHPFTVSQKKSSKPLIDSGRMNQSITYKVVKE